MRRFTIAALMIVVLVSGLAIAALKNASDAWAGVLLLLTVFLLGSAFLGIAHRRQAKRAFWQGFALFGWGYLTLTMGPWFSDQVEPRLPTTQLLHFAHNKANPPASQYESFSVLLDQIAVQPAGGPPLTVTGSLSGSSGPTSIRAGQTFRLGILNSNLEQFVRVGHCLFALLAALLGGLIARWFYRTNDALSPDAIAP